MSSYGSVPSSIFLDRALAPLESISEYLKDKKGLTYHEIATLVGRDDRTIWTCYNRAKKKRGGKPSLEIIPSVEVEIPIDIFQDRRYAPLERITDYLRTEKAMTYHEIAVLLNRDDRTIWTTYSRSQKRLTFN